MGNDDDDDSGVNGNFNPGDDVLTITTLAMIPV